MTPDRIAPGHPEPETPGRHIRAGHSTGGVPTPEAAMAEVRAMHPAWPATLVREVAGRLIGTLTTPIRNPDPPPAHLLAALV